MIWTITLWLGMQGQGHVPLSQCGIQANSDVIIDCSGATPEQVQEWKGRPCIGLELGCAPQVWQTPLEPSPGILMPPAEHVFEIRTRRDNNSPCLDQLIAQCSNLCDNPDHTGSMKGLTRAANCHLCQDRIGMGFQQCQSLTRELWMDGHRLGIILGLQ